jgi:hypothetical protein
LLELNAPHAPALPQVTIHVTAVLPPVTPLGNVAAAVRVAAAFTANDPGGGDIKTTAVGPGGGGAGALSEPPQPDTNTAMSKETIRCLICFSSVRDRCPQ